jgi:hypothetical protein
MPSAEIGRYEDAATGAWRGEIEISLAQLGKCIGKTHAAGAQAPIDLDR